MLIKKIIIWLLSLVPLVACIVLGLLGQLGPDPGKELALYLGHISFSYLLLVLAIPVLKKVRCMSWFGRCSRLLGLFAFFYVSLHLMAYAAFFVGFRLDLLVTDLLERPYVYVGFSGWVLLLVLVCTSNQWMQRKLKRHWKSLHRLIYAVIILALCHVLWLARSDIQWFVLYLSLFSGLVVVKFVLPWVLVLYKKCTD